jgi:gluconate 2-dehydrogenase gamma chain
MRFATVLGFFSDPKHGGNRDQIGWKLIQFDNAGMYEPPFGYYDAELLANKKEGQ